MRARDLGLPFEGRCGRYNAITDVPGVEVGYSTIIRGKSSANDCPRSRNGQEMRYVSQFFFRKYLHFIACHGTISGDGFT